MQTKLLSKLLLLLIILLAFLLRLYRIDNPVLDWHSWRQADTASVTREYIKHGVDLLHPQYHDLSNIPNGKNNLQGYRMVEFPIINATLALIIKQFPQLDLVTVSRLSSVWFSLGSLLCLYYICKKTSNTETALLTSLVFAVLPYNIYYSRVILPEPAMLFFSLLAINNFIIYLKTKNIKAAVITTFSLALALILKPFVAFLAPIFIILAYQQDKYFYKNLYLYLIAIISAIPFIAWRMWIKQFPTGIPASAWLLNGNGIRWRPAWFRWLFYERLTKLILGFIAIIFFPINLVKKDKALQVYAAWWIGIFAYLSVIATGNVQHDYYQILAVPIICISLARGMMIAWELISKKTSKIIATSLISILFISSMYLAWQEVKGYFNINHWEYRQAGLWVDKFTPEDAKVIAPAMGDTMFLFQTNRRGWPIGHGIEEKISQGATHYVSTNYDQEAKDLEKKYYTKTKTPNFILLDLTKPLP